MATQNFRRNRRIRVPEVRLIDENGDQAGVVATKDALQRAQNAGLDLVEVAPTARPPVCKILDWGKFNYEQSKKSKKDKGASKQKSGMKELRVRPAISEHDLSYRLEDGRKFLDEGHKVLVVCLFKGRQMAHPEHGYTVMKQVSTDLNDISKIEMQARLQGRRMTMLLSPLPLAQRRAAAKERDRIAREKEIAKERGEDVAG
ncbi:MAG: translation initiation factor IF-3 [Planctomycetota bacterium]